MKPTLYELRQEFAEREDEQLESNIIWAHHLLMREYGWIPLEEFKQLPIPTLFNLINTIQEEKKKEKEAYSEMKSRRR